MHFDGLDPASVWDTLDAIGPVTTPLGDVLDIDVERFRGITDPYRLQLMAAALDALRAPDEVWAFPVKARGAPGTHEPHLRLNVIGGRERVVVAGTRRVDGQLDLRTWFCAADPRSLLRAYRSAGRRVYPTHSYRVDLLPEVDSIHVAPASSALYSVERFASEPTVLAYVADQGLPRLVGLEIQDARRVLAAVPRYLRNLFSTNCEIDGVVTTLARHLHLPDPDRRLERASHRS